MKVTITRCCGHAESWEMLPNLNPPTKTRRAQLEAALCQDCDDKAKAWEADQFAKSGPFVLSRRRAIIPLSPPRGLGE